MKKYEYLSEKKTEFHWNSGFLTIPFNDFPFYKHTTSSAVVNASGMSGPMTSMSTGP